MLRRLIIWTSLLNFVASFSPPSARISPGSQLTLQTKIKYFVGYPSKMENKNVIDQLPLKRQKLKGKESDESSFTLDNTPKVVVVGSSNTDLVSYATHLPRVGETLHGSKFEVGFGGKGANQAVMAARLKVPVGFVSCVGNDIFGDDYLAHLKSEGVDCRHVHQVEGSTGVAQICVDEQGRNFIVIVAGANGQLMPQHVDKAGEMIHQAKVIVCQGEIPAEATLAALQYGRREGLITILNTAPADPDLPQEFYEATDILCLNEPELETISKMPVTSLNEIEIAASSMLSKGPKHIVVTMGSEGALWINGEAVVAIPAQKVKAVDTVGAGDAFVGSLACYLSNGSPMEEALKQACKIAGLSVQNKGAQTSYPHFSEVS